MGNRKRSSATGFLAELIVVIFFLIASSAVITQAYAGAERIRTRASDLNITMMATQNLTEAIRAVDDMEALEQLLIDVGLVQLEIAEEPYTSQYLLSYDDLWQPQSIDTNQANWHETIMSKRYLLLNVIINDPTEVGILLEARLIVSHADEEIFSLDTARFMVRTGGGN